MIKPSLPAQGPSKTSTNSAREIVASSWKVGATLDIVRLIRRTYLK
ncbi:MAG: hypothetical protein FWE02_05400 [Defluviitaleaceae bacterium]|nr:hypothetical protein [Defluviitaleaceae bacterium]